MGSKLKGVAVGAYLETGPKLSRAWHATRHALRAERVVSFWHQADDPWSLLLAQALRGFSASFPEVRLQPLLVPEPAADADAEPRKRVLYGLADARRLADAYGLAFPPLPVLPEPDRLRRAQAILLVDRDADTWLDAAVRVGEALFRGDGDALSGLVRELGTVPGQLVRPALEASYQRLRKAGHYTGGVLSYDGEHYWGLDRLHYLYARLEREGLGSAELTEVGRSLPPMSLRDGRARVDFYVSFRSPYSYLASRQVEVLAQRYPLDVRMRFVLPMVARGIHVPKAKLLYIAKDAKREATRLQIPFGRIHDPLGEGVKRALGLACATRRELGDEAALRLARAIGEGVWSRAVDLTTVEGLRAVATHGGLDGPLAPELEEASWRAEVEANGVALDELGLWGVPSFDLGDEVLWGRDRVRHLERRLEATFGP